MNEIKRTSIEVFNAVVNILQGHQMNSPVAILILISIRLNNSRTKSRKLNKFQDLY